MRERGYCEEKEGEGGREDIVRRRERGGVVVAILSNHINTYGQRHNVLHYKHKTKITLKITITW